MRLLICGSGDMTLISPTGPLILKPSSKLIFFGSSSETVRLSSVRYVDLPIEERYNSTDSTSENKILPLNLSDDEIISEIIMTGDTKLKCNQINSSIKISMFGKSSIHFPTKSQLEKIEIKMNDSSKFNGHDSFCEHLNANLSGNSKLNSLIVAKSSIVLSGGKCFIQMKKFLNIPSLHSLEMKSGGGRYDIID